MEEFFAKKKQITLDAIGKEPSADSMDFFIKGFMRSIFDKILTFCPDFQMAGSPVVTKKMPIVSAELISTFKTGDLNLINQQSSPKKQQNPANATHGNFKDALNENLSVGSERRNNTVNDRESIGSRMS